MSPAQSSLRLNQILAIQKLIDDQANNTNTANTNCDKVNVMKTNRGNNIVLKNCDYDLWMKKENSHVKRLQAAYFQNMKIHR